MKILQVTYFGTTTNYGAVLQAFALQKALRELGHEPVLLRADFTYCNKIKKWYKSPFNALKAWRQQQSIRREELHHPRRFAEFIQTHMAVTGEQYHTIREVRRASWDDFDAMVTGSDQVWSNKKPSPLFFLNFGPKNILRFSYAASVGTKAHSSTQYLDDFRNAVRNFTAISVREHNALELCEKAGVPATLCPDPVFLFSPADYEKALHLPPRSQEKKTCLIYLVSKNAASATEEVYRYCREHQLTPISVNSQNHAACAHQMGEEIYPDIPGWIQHIRDAELVVTDSFHGSAFSILFGKKLVIFPKKDYDARLDMLDRCFGIGPAICRGDFQQAVAFQPDYSAIREKIAMFREEGFRFLRDALRHPAAITRKNCCGCSLCAEICPKHCITMVPDECGFSVPKIDEAQCIGCDLCRKSCPLNQPESPARTDSPYFYAIGKDKDAVQNSSSGGIFPLLAARTLNAGGIVAGVKFDEKWNAVLDTIDTIGQLKLLQGSKYVQSLIAPGLFGRLKAALEQGKQVLFSGTPCQISAFRHFLKDQNYPNLLLVEVLCHGAPSPEIWQSYLRYLAQKNNFELPQIYSVSFRNKRDGWHDYALHLEDAAGKTLYHCIHKKDLYCQLFIRNLTLRDSCYHCAAKAGRSGADLALGDFWKLKKIAPELDTPSGASIVIACTEKGAAAFQQVPCEKLKEMSATACLQKFTAFFASAKKNENADRFFATWKKGGKQWVTDPLFYKTRKKGLIRRILGL